MSKYIHMFLALACMQITNTMEFELAPRNGRVQESKSPATLEQLIKAIYNHELDYASTLLEENPQLLTATDNNGGTALHHAAADGYLEGVKLLAQKTKSKSFIFKLFNNSDRILTQRNKLGNTPVVCAILKGRLETLKYLVEECKIYVGSAEHKDSRYSLWLNTLEHALTTEHTDIIDYLLNTKNFNLCWYFQFPPHTPVATFAYICTHYIDKYCTEYHYSYQGMWLGFIRKLSELWKNGQMDDINEIVKDSNYRSTIYRSVLLDIFKSCSYYEPRYSPDTKTDCDKLIQLLTALKETLPEDEEKK